MTVKLTPEQVEEIHLLHEMGVKQTRIAADYGVTEACIRYHVHPERRAAGWSTIGIHAADHDRLCVEAHHRGIAVCRLVHDLIEQGIPARLEAAE